MKVTQRPRIKISLDGFDICLEIIGALSLIFLLGYPLYNYPSLPDIIPTHFDVYGNPDHFSPKNMLAILPSIGLGLYLGLTLLNFYPHLFNYPQDITELNAAKSYKIATKLIRGLKLLISCFFAYIIFSSIQIARGNQEGLGNFTLAIFIGAIFLFMSFYFITMFKTNPHEEIFRN